jgi:hypothetical protein
LHQLKDVLAMEQSGCQYCSFLLKLLKEFAPSGQSRRVENLSFMINHSPGEHAQVAIRAMNLNEPRHTHDEFAVVLVKDFNGAPYEVLLAQLLVRAPQGTCFEDTSLYPWTPRRNHCDAFI